MSIIIVISTFYMSIDLFDLLLIYTIFDKLVIQILKELI